MKKLLLVGSAATLLLGLGSCTASLIVPDPSPNTDWSVSNGMHKWNVIKSHYKDFGRPDWCEEMSVMHDGGYSEVTCYIPVYQTQGKQTYDMVWCTLEQPESHPSCEYKKNKRSMDPSQAGKWKRYFGEEELLPEEKLLYNAKDTLLRSGFILAFAITPIIFLAFIVAAVTGNKQETSAALEEADE